MNVMVADAMVRSIVVGTLLTAALMGAFAFVRVSAAFRAAAWAAVIVLAVVLALPWAASGRAIRSTPFVLATGVHEAFADIPKSDPGAAPANGTSRPRVLATTKKRTWKSRLTVGITDAVSAGAGWVWLTLASLLLIRLGVRYARLERGLRAMPLPAGALYARLAAAAGRAGARRVPRFALSERDTTPALGGFFPPTIILPAELCTTTSDDELDCMVGHEVAHLRRHDYLVDALVRIAHALAFFNPALYLAYGRLRLDRELACDDAVVRARADAVPYAHLLVRLSRAGRRRVELALSSPAYELVRRVEAIVAVRKQRDARSSPGLVACAALAVPVWLLASNVQVVRAAPPAAAAEPRAADTQAAQVETRMDAGATLRLYGDVGSVTVQTAADDKLRVRAIPRGGARSAIALQSGAAPGDIDICSRGASAHRCTDWSPAHPIGAPRIDWQVDLPSRRPISIRTVAGPIAVRSDGAVHVWSVESNIEASGRTVDATTQQGSIVAAIAESELTSWMELDARHGTVAVSMPADLRARVVASSVHGTVRASFPIVLGKENGFDWTIARTNLREAAESQKLIVVAGGDITLRTR